MTPGLRILGTYFAAATCATGLFAVPRILAAVLS